MSGFPQPYGAGSGAGANGHRQSQQRQSGDFRSNGASPAAFGPHGNGPVPVPPGNMNNRNAMMGGPHGRGPFDGPRSPPNNKNTSHVPCKFFKQNACQAGKACPFLHSTEPATETAPCKYFAKGNCKFGAKCALAHILPNGQRVNRPDMPVGALPARMNVMPGKDPALASSLLSIAARNVPPGIPMAQPDYEQLGHTPQKPQFDKIPTIDTTFSSYPGSAYGSPPSDPHGRLPTSPNLHPSTAMDAPLPASFDSQGISHAARYGPIAQSVPSTFGLESPPSSLPNNRGALQQLRYSAYGDNQKRVARPGQQASSPPTEPVPFARRAMHSERFSTRPKMISASLGANGPMSAISAGELGSDDEWTDDFALEEEYVPNALHDLLTPQERMRRSSRNGDEESPLTGRRSLSGFATPNENLTVGSHSSKVGSPGAGLGTSPSRFSHLFASKNANSATISKQPSLNELAARSPTSAELYEIGTTARPSQPAFSSHVGSPLRNASLYPTTPTGGPNPTSHPTSKSSSPALRPVASPSLRPIGSRTTSGSRPPSGDLTSLIASRSPPRQSSMSIISQQLQRTRIESRAAEENRNGTLQHPTASRALSNPSVGSTGSGMTSPNSGFTPAVGGTVPMRGNFDRAVSSSSIGRSDKIDEETAMFEMEADPNESGSGTGPNDPRLVGSNTTVPQAMNTEDDDTLGASGGTYADHAKNAPGKQAGVSSYWPWAGSGRGRTDPGVIGGGRGKQ
ncbi:hypothetical protein EV356DRAFT_341129 [Viridothelium virens]|uniref:C3H1-type domain-containing protein n=1 Tax=Viridothelium virens TaxID=1048519 RepID=A0A6A6GY57_VIRVR|nr:hypothetical protein EV356DRAFT_341129 [Viridothelium virens]